MRKFFLAGEKFETPKKYRETILLNIIYGVKLKIKKSPHRSEGTSNLRHIALLW